MSDITRLLASAGPAEWSPMTSLELLEHRLVRALLNGRIIIVEHGRGIYAYTGPRFERSERRQLPVLGARPYIERLRWSTPRVPVGQPVLAMFDYRRFSGGEAFEIEIFERDKSGSPRVLDTLSGRLDRSDGVAAVEWVRTPEAVEEDLNDDLDGGETGPIEYYFSVRVAGRRHEEQSGLLWIEHDIKVVITDPRGALDERPNIVFLTDATGRRMRGVSEAGLVRFSDVVVGAVTIEVEPAAGVCPC